MYMYIFYQSHLKYIYPYFLLTRLSLNLTSMFMLQLCEDDALLGIILLSVLVVRCCLMAWENLKGRVP